MTKRKSCAIYPIWSIPSPIVRLSSTAEDSNLEETTGAGQSSTAASSQTAKQIMPKSLLDSTNEDFGDSFPYTPRPNDQQRIQTFDEVGILERNRSRNIIVAISSLAVAICNYAYQFTHPTTAVAILLSMQSSSPPLSVIGHNGKPTVIDFWAPWCTNCRYAAPTLHAVEREYGDRVNFVLVNADEGGSWPLIRTFGVDAIPHLALVDGEGDVETALIGPVSRRVLRADLDALLSTEQRGCDKRTPVVGGREAAVAVTVTTMTMPSTTTVCHDDLPYKMYDAFGNRSEESRRVNFAER